MTLIWAGLTLGAVYALVAIGYNIVFMASGAFNFAHAQLVMIGTFVAYWGLTILRWPAVAVFLLAAAVVAMLAALEERLAIRTVHTDEAMLVTTVGVASVLDGGTQLIWGNQPLTVPFMNSGQIWTLLGGRVPPVDIVLIAAVAASAFGIVYWSRRTMTGLTLLAMAENREAAMLRGINARVLTLVVFAVSGAMAGLAGPLVGPVTFAVATLASALALKGFVALALGGFGSVTGGLLGGLAVGLVEECTDRYAGEQYADLATFAVLILVLMIRPTGLFGRVRERAV